MFVKAGDARRASAPIPKTAITRRNFLRGASGSALAAVAACGQSSDPLAADVGEMLMLCFRGTTTGSVTALI